MPKTRKRLQQVGAKSVRIKHKIGGRKSSRGVKQMSNADLFNFQDTCRPRDRNKVVVEMFNRAARLWDETPTIVA